MVSSTTQPSRRESKFRHTSPYFWPDFHENIYPQDPRGSDELDPGSINNTLNSMDETNNRMIVRTDAPFHSRKLNLLALDL
jgi:hypothetical protein